LNQTKHIAKRLDAEAFWQGRLMGEDGQELTLDRRFAYGKSGDNMLKRNDKAGSRIFEAVLQDERKSHSMLPGKK
jgi:hypothetical protein